MNIYPGHCVLLISGAALSKVKWINLPIALTQINRITNVKNINEKHLKLVAHS